MVTYDIEGYYASATGHSWLVWVSGIETYGEAVVVMAKTKVLIFEESFKLRIVKTTKEVV